MRRLSGLLIVGIGVIHTLFGLAGGYPIWAEIARAGFFDTVGSRILGSSHIFWFTFAGPLLILFGQLCFWTEKHLKRPVPLLIAVQFFGLSAVGVLLDPDSGFWLLLAVAIYMVVLARRVQTESIKSGACDS